MVSVEKQLIHRAREAERIVRSAGQLARHHFARTGDLRVERKGLQDYVSAADREVEALIKTELASTFPGEGFLGEESGGVIEEPIWVTDPIDGTTNFLRAIPLYGISLAFVRDGRTEVGVIYLPELDELYSATIASPTLRNGQPTAVRSTSELDEALVILGYNVNRPEDGFLSGVERLSQAKCEFRRFGSATLALCMVASGRADAFWQPFLQPWDALAGLLLVEQSGGCANDFLADDGLRAGSPVLATSKAIADKLSAHLRVPLKDADVTQSTPTA